MPTVNFADATNPDILNAIRDNSGLDYQARIPEATQGNVSETLRTIQSWQPATNAFASGLVNLIGRDYAHSLSWRNPLAEFKTNSLMFGDTIREMKTGLLQAKQYSGKENYGEKMLFEQEAPYIEANYHEVNRENMYKFTLNRMMLKRAFTGETPLNEIISSLMEAPVTSDNYDEFLLTCRLLAEYEALGGFFHVKVPDLTTGVSTEADAKSALKTIRAVSGNMRFLSRDYNAAKLPVAVNDPSELMLITSPEFNAALDVDALAGMFNVERGKVNERIVEIPKQNFGVDGMQAILTTKDFFVIADTFYDTTSAENAAGRYYNFFLHHDQIISASRFVPAIHFSSLINDEVIHVNNPVTSISTFTAVDSEGTTVTTLARGHRFQIAAAGVTTPVSDQNKAVEWTLSGVNSEMTQIDANGFIEIAENETATTVTVKATTTWINPADATAQGVSSSFTYSITGDIVNTWPVEHDHEEPEVPEVTEDPEV